MYNHFYSRFHRVQSSLTKQLHHPTARAGGVRRFCSPAPPPPPPPPTTPPSSVPPPPGDGGASGGGGGAQWTRLALQLGAGLVAVAGVAVGSLPAVLSTHWGLQKAVELVNTQLPGRLEVAEARLSWLGGNELQCVKVYDSPRGGTILMHLNRVTTSASMWALLTGSDDFNVVIAKPWINTVYDSRLADFKLINFLEKAGLLTAPPLQEPPPQQQLTSQQLQQSTQNSGSQSQVDVYQKTESSKPATTQSTSTSEAATTTSSSSAPASQLSQPPQQQHPQSPQPKSQSGRQSPTSLVGVLGRVNSKMDINADVRLGRMNLVVTDGMLLVAEEMRHILGPGMHIAGAVGQRQLREWAEEVGEDVSWAADTRSGPPAVAQNPDRYRPGVLQVHSEHLRGEMRLWDTSDHTLLQQPATARLDLTPALSRLGLAAANPLLGNVVEVRGGERLALSFMPEGGKLPYNAATAEMAPVTLSLGPASLAAQLLTELGLQPPTTISPSTASGGLSASLSLTRVHFTRGGQLRTERVDMQLVGGSTGTRGGGSVRDNMEAAGQPEMEVERGTAERGGGGGRVPRGVHVAVWGAADLQRDQVDFTLGVAPGPLLGAMGLPRGGLPAGYMLLVPLKGTAAAAGEGGAPRYEVGQALIRLGQIGARQKAVQWLEAREQGREEAGGEARTGFQKAVGGLLRDLLVAAAAPQELIASVDQVLLRDMERIPPPTACYKVIVTSGPLKSESMIMK